MKYIKCIKDTVLLTAGKWYGINELNFYSAIITVFRPSDNDWVMSDKENFDRGFLSEHNPDLENETQPITKDNIKEVLDFNNITDISVHTNSLGKKHCFSLSMKSDNWLDIFEAIIGKKLKSLPKLEVIELKVGDSVEVAYIYSAVKVIKLFDYDKQKVHYEGGTFDYFKSMKCDYIKSVNGKSGIYKIPPFNFEQYLLDKGFKLNTSKNYMQYCLYNICCDIFDIDVIWQHNQTVQPTKENADILIAMANLAKDLK